MLFHRKRTYDDNKQGGMTDALLPTTSSPGTLSSASLVVGTEEGVPGNLYFQRLFSLKNKGTKQRAETKPPRTNYIYKWIHILQVKLAIV